VSGSFTIEKYLAILSIAAQVGTAAFAVSERIKIGVTELRQLIRAIVEDLIRWLY